jgi:hypothetical protein
MHGLWQARAMQSFSWVYKGELMKLNTLITTGCMALVFGTYSSAWQTGSPATTPTDQSGTAGPTGSSGDPSTHGTTDRAGQTPQPIGTGGTAVDQGKGGNGKPVNGSSDKKGKRKPKHGPTEKGGDQSAR